MLVSPLVLILTSASVSATSSLVTLFDRGGNLVPEIGTVEWKSLYPNETTTTPTKIPQSWLDKLYEVEAAGLLPSTDVNPVATLENGLPTYGSLNSSGPGICSVTYGCYSPDDIVHAPDGFIGIAQDDGPLPPGIRLYEYFKQQGINGTVFLIGKNIIANPDVFVAGLTTPGLHQAVHTWTHPYMTAKTNEEVVAELGWTMQIIAESTGRIPAWWRPPFGDVDCRVRAIAKHVFDLTTVIWSHDSGDWRIPDSGTLEEAIGNLTQVINGTKSPGAINLEHELTDAAVTAFITVYPLMLDQGWKTDNIPSVFGKPWYKNALDDCSAIIPGISLVSNASIVSPAANGCGGY